jgi:hypothetical protein
VKKRRDTVDVIDHGDSVEVLAPAARSRVLMWLGFGLAVPWLVAFVAGSAAAAALVPAGQRKLAVLGVLWVNLLAAVVHILALAAAWLAVYAWRGEERISLDARRFEVLRVAAGVRVPFRLNRHSGDAVRVLGARESAPGRGPHPRLEWVSHGSAVRFGAGLTEGQAAQVAEVLERWEGRRGGA